MNNVNKRKIIIVECYSSSVNYIHDIRERGYEPVLLERYMSEEERKAERNLNDKAYAFNSDIRPMVIMADESYDNTLSMVRELDPVLIIPGCDLGIELSLKLSNDLGLKSNPLSILENMRDKLSMQKALEKAGIRHIKTKAVNSAEEAIDFFKENKNKKVVLKLTQGASSINVFICDNEDEIRKAHKIVSLDVKKRNREGESVIIQEFIEGEEYAVDTISCMGEHVALYGMHYQKKRCKGYGNNYDLDYYFSPTDGNATELIDYLFEVLDCLGIVYGPVHSEIVVNDKGPVLIEVNCRPAGAFQKYSYQDMFMENHETAVSLDSYFMSKKEFLERYPRRMKLKQFAVAKEICLDRDYFVKKVKLEERLSKLKSFFDAVDNGENCIYKKTVDLSTHGGIVYLTSEDKDRIEEDVSEILRIEAGHLDELYEFE